MPLTELTTCSEPSTTIRCRVRTGLGWCGWLAWVLGNCVLLGSPSLRAPADAAPTVSFRNDVMAVLSKGGCASGPCHGNRQGKGGFRISLRGEDPSEDYQTLIQDLAGRRLDRQSPEDSLLLLKPTGLVPHEGRVRFEPNSLEYGILERWIREGARSDVATAPRLTALAVEPREPVLHAPVESFQLRVLAQFEDGTSQDVTRLAVYEPVAPIVDVTVGGRATFRQEGETTILVRYLDRQEAVRAAHVPSRDRVWSWQLPTPANAVDALIYEKLKRLRLEPSARCSDEEFLRRVFLDLCGILPTANEARGFVADSTPDKRTRVVEALLDRPEFAEYWALKWADLFRLEERALDKKGVQLFHEWLVQQVVDNTPLDVFARSVLTARGSTYAVPAANWFRSHRTAVERSEAVAQVFLGARLQCAQCHNHPYERWTQNDYHDWTAAFAKVDYKVIENLRRDDNDKHEFVGEQLIHVVSKAEHKHPRSGKVCSPRLLGQGEALNDSMGDPLLPLADWLVRPENPLFARAQANRIWYHLMGRGLVDPIDDFRSTNPASHPELLETLAQELIAARFDIRHLIRRITASRSYQASSVPRAGQPEDPLNYSHAIVRRLTAEQILDSASQAAGVPLDFVGRPVGTRSAQLPSAESERRRGRKDRGNSGADLDIFLKAFGKPPRQLTTECERNGEPAMNQVFQLISGPTLQEFVSIEDNRLKTLLASGKPLENLLDELYWSVLTRPPSEFERQTLLTYLQVATDGSARRAAMEDILWGLLNSKEFVLRR